MRKILWCVMVGCPASLAAQNVILDAIKKEIEPAISRQFTAALQSQQIVPLVLAPGRVVCTPTDREQSIEVANASTDTMTVILQVRDSILISDTGQEGVAAEGTPFRPWPLPLTWVRDVPKEITVPPRESRRIAVRVAAPDSVRKGDYSAVIILTPVAKPVNTTSSQTLASRVVAEVVYRSGADIPVGPAARPHDQ